jgi:DNA-damage-inducible protein D
MRSILRARQNTAQRVEKLRELKQVRAREIYGILGYATWQNFEVVMRRARDACVGVGTDSAHHFSDTTKLVTVGSGAERRVPDVFLSRTACYLVAMNGEPAKPEIAAAQAYFAIQTRRMELRDAEDAELAHDQRRLELRERVTESHKRVSRVAKNAGVRNSSQPFFHDARYRGLYGAPLKNIRIKKGISEKENPLDRAGPLELSANDFQMNLASQVIPREGIASEVRAIARNQELARRVRQVISESGLRGLVLTRIACVFVNFAGQARDPNCIRDGIGTVVSGLAVPSVCSLTAYNPPIMRRR